jgi:LysR family transcriptional regulator, regulator for genes of the gallate degradation pathway
MGHKLPPTKGPRMTLPPQTAPLPGSQPVIQRSLRHLRVFLAVADLRSPTAAAERCRVSQPAVTQALARLEQSLGGALFDRTRQGFFLTGRGAVLDARLRRAMTRLDAALAEVSPRLTVTATVAQLQALTGVAEAQNVTLAARALGLAQPTVQRAVTQIEQAAGRALFERTAFGMLPTRACRGIAQAAQLAFSEFAQADADLAELDGRDGGRIVVGALPLSRSVLLPEALARFRAERPLQPVSVLDGPYGEMLGGLRRGEIDLILGALRSPLPIGDVVQEALFADGLAIVARPGHPLGEAGPVGPAVLAQQAWVVPRPGTPARDQFDGLFDQAGLPRPASIIDCGSILLMRELLTRSDLLGCISAAQAKAEIRRGLLIALPVPIDWPARDIGLTYRAGWMPTTAQALLLGHLRAVAGGLSAEPGGGA